MMRRCFSCRRKFISFKIIWKEMVQILRVEYLIKKSLIIREREDEDLEDRVLVTAQTPGKCYLMARCAFIFSKKRWTFTKPSNNQASKLPGMVGSWWRKQPEYGRWTLWATLGDLQVKVFNISYTSGVQEFQPKPCLLQIHSTNWSLMGTLTKWYFEKL